MATEVVIVGVGLAGLVVKRKVDGYAGKKVLLLDQENRNHHLAGRFFPFSRYWI